MKKASDTNQDEILDESFLHRGGSLGWSVFETSRLTPFELAARMDEGVDDEVEDVRGAVMMRMLDLVLAGWNSQQDVDAVGSRALSFAAAVNHAAGAGVVLPGSRRIVEGGERLEISRRILDFWFMDWKPGKSAPRDVGKRVLAVGKFLCHAELDDWSLSALGRACGETPAGMMERVRKTCNRPIERQGGRGKAAWQQGREQRAGSAEAQRERARKRKGKRKD